MCPLIVATRGIGRSSLKLESTSPIFLMIYAVGGLVMAPWDAEETSAAYLANTPVG